MGHGTMTTSMMSTDHQPIIRPAVGKLGCCTCKLLRWLAANKGVQLQVVFKRTVSGLGGSWQCCYAAAFGYVCRMHHQHALTSCQCCCSIGLSGWQCSALWLAVTRQIHCLRMVLPCTCLSKYVHVKRLFIHCICNPNHMPR